ncbi:MAG: hypothetical protein IJC16_00210 [Rikenellaceae bacterium]|nr:hypothetical protein [Rikenellaceae bacterium]
MAKDYAILMDDDLVIEPVRDASGLILSGLVIGNTSVQNQQALLISSRGDIKSDLLTGVGAAGYLNGDDADSLTAAICSQFKADGMTVTAVQVNDSTIKIKARYGNMDSIR